MTSRLLLWFVALVGIAAPLGLCNQHANRDRELSQEYKSLVARYAAIPEGDFSRGTSDLRATISKLCDEIVKRRLPIGVDGSEVIDALGKPQGEIGDTILYYGRQRSWFHFFTFEYSKLVAHQEGVILDVEGGR